MMANTPTAPTASQPRVSGKSMSDMDKKPGLQYRTVGIRNLSKTNGQRATRKSAR